jgi:hypothetical protein
MASLNHSYNVYVLEAHDLAGRPVLYVGSTGKEPSERLRDHARGCKRYCPLCRCRKYVRGHRMRLRHELFAHYNPMSSRREAEEVERWLAQRLKRRGHQVVGGH